MVTVSYLHLSLLMPMAMGFRIPRDCDVGTLHGQQYRCR